mmetsp:Transcript_41248/g.129593  ORF Transcript_41248/g.129593 Transcript_41248/m.129593 type:complete len:221 (-) Transcript_41248:971-1633(-)
MAANTSCTSPAAASCLFSILSFLASSSNFPRRLWDGLASLLFAAFDPRARGVDREEEEEEENLPCVSGMMSSDSLSCFLNFPSAACSLSCASSSFSFASPTFSAKVFAFSARASALLAIAACCSNALSASLALASSAAACFSNPVAACITFLERSTPPPPPLFAPCSSGWTFLRKKSCDLLPPMSFCSTPPDLGLLAGQLAVPGRGAGLLYSRSGEMPML